MKEIEMQNISEICQKLGFDSNNVMSISIIPGRMTVVERALNDRGRPFFDPETSKIVTIIHEYTFS
jgi:hypothetical protein